MKKTVIALLALVASFNANAQDYTNFVDGDNVVGSITAPITFIEYASMTCGHCATFDKNVVQQLKKDYVESGKVAYALRPFPLDKIAMAVSKVQRCAPRESYYDFVEAFFSTQRQWLGSSDPLSAIKTIAKMGGMTEEKVEECILDEKIQREVNMFKQSGISLGVNSTPTFFINGKMYRGVGSYQQVKNVIEAELAK